MSLSKADLKMLAELVANALGRPRPAAFTEAELEPLYHRVVREHAETVSARDFGPLVYRLILPLYQKRTVAKGASAGKQVRDILAPTLNEYGSMETWRRAQLYKALDLRILEPLAGFPRALLRGERRARGVRVVRHSASCPDEITVDVVGGKVPVDRLVIVGILAGDTPALLERSADWQLAPRGQGRLVIEVHDLAWLGLAFFIRSG